jgi:hypothetical protein
MRTYGRNLQLLLTVVVSLGLPATLLAQSAPVAASQNNDLPPPQPQAAAPAGPVAAPPAPEPFPFDYRASIFSRSDVREGYRGVGLKDSDSVRYRTRFGLISKPIDTGAVDVVIKFLPQASGVWNVGGDTLEDPSLALHEGSVQLRHGLSHLEVGRFEMVYGEHFVIGNVDWHEAGRAFDGVRLHVENESKIWVDGFFSLVNEGGGQALGKGDVYFAGVYAGLGEALRTKLALDVYALGQFRPQQAPATEPRLARGTLGVRAKDRLGVVDYRVELGAQLGVEGAQDIFAYQGDLEVGLFLLDDRLRVAAEGLYASGDDPSTVGTNEGWSQLYPTAHKWLGLSDIMGGRSNVGAGVLHVLGTPHADWKLAWDVHLFARPEAGALPSGLAGVESDVGAQYAIGRGLGLRTLYATFLPMNDHYGTERLAHFWELELRFDH